MAAIFLVSAQSQAPMPSGMSDVSAHVLAYAGLGLLVIRAVSGGMPNVVTPRSAFAALAMTVAYGVSDELHQMFVPGRTAEMKDVFSDATGAVLGIILWWGWGILGVRSDV